MSNNSPVIYANQEYIVEVKNSWTTQSRGKRAFDIGVSLFMLLLFAPLIVTVALVLKCTSKGPVVYPHVRIGKNGRPFRCYKFRTMVLDSDARLNALLESDPALRAEWALNHKLQNDPRVIPGIGYVLRKSSLDELPQIFNVLSGEMSIVGPRPIVEDELHYYGVMRSQYLSVRPGLTGPWQSSSGLADSGYSHRVQMDLLYVQTGTLWKDVGVVFVTARKFLSFKLNGA